jgi:hypothetical protein
MFSAKTSWFLRIRIPIVHQLTPRESGCAAHRYWFGADNEGIGASSKAARSPGVTLLPARRLRQQRGKHVPLHAECPVRTRFRVRWSAAVRMVGAKGMYYVNAVDCVTQWHVEACC